MKKDHRHIGDAFVHYQQSQVEFDLMKTQSKINLIDAFNKKFIFYYMSHENSSNLIFLIFLIGRKSDAQKYLIDFELKDGLRKLKFIETCYSDAVDLSEIIGEHRCFVIPKKLAATFTKNDQLVFRFVLKRKDAVEDENQLKQNHLKGKISNDSSSGPSNGGSVKKVEGNGQKLKTSNDKNGDKCETVAQRFAGRMYNRNRANSLNKSKQTN